MTRSLLSLLFVVHLISCSGQPPIFPGEEWSYHEDPASAGWSEEGRDAFRSYLVDSTVITGCVIVHKGQIVFEYGDVVENSYIASCRKSVLAMLYGKYVLDGQIDLNKTVGDLGLDDVEQ